MCADCSEGLITSCYDIVLCSVVLGSAEREGGAAEFIFWHMVVSETVSVTTAVFET